jgi:hypothetical protein
VEMKKVLFCALDLRSSLTLTLTLTLTFDLDLDLRS